MEKTNNTPNWELVTDQFHEPTTCGELAALLTPTEPTGNEQSIISLSWKKKEFYKKENIITFLAYAQEKFTAMSTIDKNQFTAVMRMMRLYREIDDKQAAYQLAKDHEIISYLYTSIHFSSWDTVTKTTALSYLVSKYKVIPFENRDHKIFHKVKLDMEWTNSFQNLLTHQELFSFYLWYVKVYGKHMSQAELEDYLMGIATYLMNHFVDLFNEKTAVEYCKWVYLFSQLPINKAIIYTHRALSSHLIELLNIVAPEKIDDYNLEIKELLIHVTPEFLERYYELVGKLISYIPFYEKFSTRLQISYFEDLVLSFVDAHDGQTQLMKSFLLPLLISDFGDFMMTLFQFKKNRLIESILCDWLATDDHEYLKERYEMEVLYSAFGKG